MHSLIKYASSELFTSWSKVNRSGKQTVRCNSAHSIECYAHGSTLAQDYCGVAESTGLGRDRFSQKRALSSINANLLTVLTR